MGSAGKFGAHYSLVADRFYHALEWRYNEIEDKTGATREKEILAKLLDLLLADQISHDFKLSSVENALREFQKVRIDSFTPGKYGKIMALMGVEDKETQGYHPHFFGTLMYESRPNT